MRDTGTWADYVSALMSKYNLRETWEHSKWGERFWKTLCPVSLPFP